MNAMKASRLVLAAALNSSRLLRMAACAAFKLRPKLGSGRSAQGIIFASTMLLFFGGMPKNDRISSSLACRQPVGWPTHTHVSSQIICYIYQYTRTPPTFRGLASVDIEIFERFELKVRGWHTIHSQNEGHKICKPLTTSISFPFCPFQPCVASIKRNPPLRARYYLRHAARPLQSVLEKKYFHTCICVCIVQCNAVNECIKF